MTDDATRSSLPRGLSGRNTRAQNPTRPPSKGAGRPADSAPSLRKTPPGQKSHAKPKGTAKRSGPAAPVERLPRAGSRLKGATYKTDVPKRVVAAFIDLVVACVIPIGIFFQAGFYVALVPLVAYLLLRDGLPIAALGYQSVGKKILSLQVEQPERDQERVDLVTSLKRNWPLVVGFVPLAAVWQWNAALGVGLAVLPMGVELAAILTDPNGLRLGDRLAGTKVLD